MKTAKNMATQHCPEKPTPSQTSPPSRLSQLLSIFTSHTLPHTTFPSSLTLLLQTRAHVPACTQARNQPLNHSPTSVVGISPIEQLADVQVVPGWLLSLCLAQHSPLPAPAPTPHSARITPPNTHTGTEKELAEYPHYAASVHQQKKEQDDKKQAGRVTD